MTYDALGRRMHLQDPDAGPSDRLYNAFGEVAQEQLGDSTMPPAQLELITYTRDQLGRVVSEASLHEAPNTFQWDTQGFGIGRLAGSLSSDGTTRGYAYFATGDLRLENWTISGTTYTAEYEYDATGRLDRMRYPSIPGRNRFGVSYHYDRTGVADAICDMRLNLPTAPCDPATGPKPIWRANSRQADGQLIKETFGNDEITIRSYTDPRGFLTRIQTARGTATTQSIDYGYDLNGNLQTRFDNLPLSTPQTFDYDALDRLVSLDDVVHKTNFTYDDTGNFTSRVVSTPAGTELSRLDYSFIPSATPHNDMMVSGTRYWFDGRGRNTRVGSEWNASREVTYTPFDLPRQIDVSGGSQRWTFKYDADHHRVEKHDWWRFSVYVGDLYEQHQDWDGIRHMFFVHGPDRVVAELEVDTNGNDKFLYLHDDHLGSVDAATDQSGTVQRFQYDVFGARSPSQFRDVKKGFTFHHHDDDVTEQADNPGIIDMKGRVYDPKIGRFMTADPIASPLFSQGQNRYAYAGNNPLAFADPSGFETTQTCGGNCEANPPLPPGRITTEITIKIYNPPAATAPAAPRGPSPQLMAAIKAAVERDNAASANDAKPAAPQSDSAGPSGQTMGGAGGPPNTAPGGLYGGGAPEGGASPGIIGQFFLGVGFGARQGLPFTGPFLQTESPFDRGVGGIGRAFGLGAIGAFQAVLGVLGAKGGQGLVLAGGRTLNPVAVVSGAALTTAGVALGAYGVSTMGRAFEALRTARASGGEGDGGGSGDGTPKPPYRANPAHDPRSPSFNPSKTPEPPDAASVYQGAIEGDGHYYGLGGNNEIYRFSSDNAGGAHFSGMTGEGGVRFESIPIEVRRALGRIR
jgi:RHS repeat-associated protein